MLRGWANRSPARVQQGPDRRTQEDPSVAQEMQPIKQAILKADRRVLAEYGRGGISFNPAMERYMELEKLPKTRAAGRVSINSYTPLGGRADSANPMRTVRTVRAFPLTRTFNSNRHTPEWNRQATPLF